MQDRATSSKIEKVKKERELNMLELKKENVQMLRVKNKAVSQVTFDVDYNVPDAKATWEGSCRARQMFPWMKSVSARERPFSKVL